MLRTLAFSTVAVWAMPFDLRGNLVAIRLLLFYKCVETLVRATEFRSFFVLISDNGLCVLIVAFT